MDDNSRSDDIFKHERVKDFCTFVYIVSLIIFYVAMAYVLYKIFSSKEIIVINVILIIASMIIAPIAFMVCIYPIYALAHLCQKTEKIEEKQKEMELLVAEVAARCMELKNDIRNKE